MPQAGREPPAPGPASRHEDGGQWGAWMQAAQAGDKAAYHALLSGIVPYLRAIARRYLGSPEDVEDAVQEILIAVNDVRHTYEAGRPFKPWLGTIAQRRCIDLLRRRTRRHQQEVLAESDAFLDGVEEEGPEHALTRQHLRRSLDASVSALPARQRDAVRLLHLRELSLRDASVESRQSIGALKVACHRALKTLERKLSDVE